LYSQIYNKMENFGQSVDYLSDLLLSQDTQMDEEGSLDYILEDLAANFFNSLSLLIWKNYLGGLPTQLNENRRNALNFAVKFCFDKSDKVTLREVYLNLCIFLAVNTTCKLGIYEENVEKEYTQTALEFFYARLNEAEEDMDMDEEMDELDDKAKDRIIANILEAIFQDQTKKVRVEAEKIERAFDALEDLEASDVVLKASIVSYLLYMKVGGEGEGDFFTFGKHIDQCLNELKQAKLGDKFKEIVTQNLKYNKAVTLFLRGKHSEVKDCNLTNDKNLNNLMKHFVLMKKKDTDKLEEIFTQLSGSIQDKVTGVLMQIAVYHQANNQAQFIQKFQHLMNVSQKTNLK